MPSLAAGMRLGPYEVEGLLGSGGMGEVYRARDGRLGRSVALKVLPRDAVAEPTRLKRFEQEARLASSLNHPNIVTVYEVGHADETTYLAMELVEGETLDRYAASGRLPLRDRLNLAVQIARGLARAHEAGIVHRDLKPQNVMVTADGLVKILDFGLGKLASPLPGGGSASDDSTRSGGVHTSQGTILGTIDYMSPEQASGASIDFRSDQFSFGSLLYELLTGRRPFQRPTSVQILSAIIEQPPTPLLELDPGLPVRLASLVERALAKSAEDRYGSTKDLVRDLEAIAEELRAGRIGPRRRRIPRRWMAAAGTLAVLGGAWFSAPWRTGEAPPSSMSLPAEKRLAVLPFVNVGGDEPGQAFSDGLMELLTTKLTQLERFQGALRVVPASEVRREEVESAREAYQAFGVGMVITGSVQRTADRIRLTMNLVDPVSLDQLRATSVDTLVRDVSGLQDRVISEVTELLDLELAPAARDALLAGGTAEPGAYDFYVQGRGYLQRFEDLDNVRNAAGLFRRALAADPGYALAHAALGEAYWREYELTKDASLIEQARESCEAALRIDEALPEARLTLGIVEAGMGGYEAAIGQFQAALAIDPSSAAAYRGLGQAYEALGRPEQAEATYRKAIEARPGDWAGYNRLGAFYAAQGRYDEAEPQFQRVIELTPDNARAYSNLGGLYALMGRQGEAAAMLERSVEIRPTGAAYSNLATTYFNQQRYADAARMFERAVEAATADYRVWRNLAASYYWAPGERGKAQAAYRKAAALAERELAVNPRRPSVIAHLADCYAMLGQRGRAIELLVDALRQAPDDPGLRYTGAMIYEHFGDRDRALDEVRSALRLGLSADRIDQAPSLAGLREDHRFRQIVQQ